MAETPATWPGRPVSHARAATPAEAAGYGDIVVVTVPLKAYRQALAEPVAGKVVIDTTNYCPDRPSRGRAY
jgi:hypothetical protein